MTGVERARFAAHIHGVRVGADLIVLDLSQDDYLCLPDCGELEINGDLVSGPLADLLRLAAEELLAQSGVSPTRPPPPPPPRASLAPDGAVRPTLDEILTFGAMWVDAARSRPTVQELARRVENRQGRRDDLQAIARRVDVFRQLLPLAPWTGACLFQSELLLRFLNAGGLDADWVFGVRAWPFLAHCWLQLGDHCVSEAPETLTIYRPIMAL